MTCKAELALVTSQLPLELNVKFTQISRFPESSVLFLLFHTALWKFRVLLICKKSFHSTEIMKSNFEASRSHRAAPHNMRKTKPGEGDLGSNPIAFCATLVNNADSPLRTCFLIRKVGFIQDTIQLSRTITQLRVFNRKPITYGL